MKTIWKENDSSAIVFNGKIKVFFFNQNPPEQIVSDFRGDYSGLYLWRASLYSISGVLVEDWGHNVTKTEAPIHSANKPGEKKKKKD